MKQIRIIILALPLLALPALAAGEEVSLDRCREMALENNRRIAIARQADEQAAYTVKATKANFFPKFSAGAYGLYASSANDMNWPSATYGSSTQVLWRASFPPPSNRGSTGSPSSACPSCR